MVTKQSPATAHGVAGQDLTERKNAETGGAETEKTKSEFHSKHGEKGTGAPLISAEESITQGSQEGYTVDSALEGLENHAKEDRFTNEGKNFLKMRLKESWRAKKKEQLASRLEGIRKERSRRRRVSGDICKGPNRWGLV